MVAASEVEPYTPLDLPSVAVAADGTLAAVHEIGRITLVALPGAAAFAEIGVDPDADGNDLAWIGAPPRLVVLSRYPSNSTVHLLDPDGPRSLAEVRLDAPMRLAATVGASALAVGPSHVVVLTASEASLVPHQFLARSTPTAVGAAASQFVVALPGAIEEWDPLTRTPKRRLRLPRMAAITAVGGSERLVWMASQQDPARIDVIPLVNRGQPKAHELPEPIAQLLGHPRSDLVACIGQSGRLYLVDLDGRQPLREIHGSFDHVASAGLLVGRTHGILAAQAGHPLAVVPLDSRAADPARAAGASNPASAVLPRPAPPAPFAVPPPAPVYAAMVAAPAPALASAATGDARQTPPRGSAVRSWRDGVLAWTRAALAGTIDSGEPPAPLIDALRSRFGLAPALQPVLVMLYGAHLSGQHGVAPADIARLLHSWDEALGRGELARHGIVDHTASRVVLSPAILRVLDELPPQAEDS